MGEGGVSDEVRAGETVRGSVSDSMIGKCV